MKHLLSGILLTSGNFFSRRYLSAMGLSLLLTLITGNTYAQAFEWVKGLGGSGSEFGQDVAVDGSGNVYVTGFFQSSVDFNPGGSGGTLTAAGSFDVFLAKYDPTGKLLWANNMGGKDSDVGWGVAVDANSNVFVTGHYYRSADFNPGGSGGTLTALGGVDVFLAKYDTDGKFLWAKTMGGRIDDEDYSDVGYDVAVDGNGNVLVTGYFNSATADFNPGGTGGTLTAPNDNYKLFLAKYDADGNFLWAKGTGGNREEIGQAVAVDEMGNVFVSGASNSTLPDFNLGGSGGTVTTSGGLDVVLAKYDASGNFLWAKAMGGNLEDRGQGMTVDRSGNVLVVGHFRSGLADFNPGGSGGTLSKTNTSSNDVFLAKYDGTGKFLWVKATIEGDAYGRGVASDGVGNAYITGFSNATTDFNPGGNGGKVTTTGVYDIFLTKYDADGSFLWAKGMGGSVDDRGYDLAVDGSGNAFLTGYSNSPTSNFNPGGSGGTVNNMGVTDAFLVKLGCSDTTSSYHSATLECGDSYVLNDSSYTAEGIYIQVFPNRLGCDSTVTLELTVIPIDQPIIQVDGFTLIAPSTYATYQWLLEGTPIDGANDSVYTVKENGAYQVVVTNGKGCSDTSEIYSIRNYVAIEGVRISANQIRVYPNPAADRVYIQSAVEIKVTLTDIAGRTIAKPGIEAGSLSLKGLAEGIYLLHLTDKDGLPLKTEKIMKK